MAEADQTHVVTQEREAEWERIHAAHDRQAVMLEDGRKIGSYCFSCCTLYITRCPPD